MLHGHLRTTADLDLVVELDTDNARRAMNALTALGYKPRPPVSAQSFADAATRESWIRDKNHIVFSMWNPSAPAFEVDLIVAEPFDFDEVFERALRVPLETTETMVISLEDLIEMKRRTARPRDIEDIKALEALAMVGEDEDG